MDACALADLRMLRHDHLRTIPLPSMETPCGYGQHAACLQALTASDSRTHAEKRVRSCRYVIFEEYRNMLTCACHLCYGSRGMRPESRRNREEVIIRVTECFRV